MKVLVTGATGMVGAELTRQLLAEGVDVRILRRQSSDVSLLGEAASAVEHVIGDVTDAASLTEATRGVAHIYHCAAFVGMGPGVSRAALDDVNVGGTANVVNAALRNGVSRLVHTSSMAAFGRPESSSDFIDENTTWHTSKNNTAYARSKYHAELEVLRGVAEGLDAVMVNPALVFGHARPGENRAALDDVNVGGTANVVNAALRNGVSRLVHTSSMAAFGRPESSSDFIDENTTWHTSKNNTAYARSKYHAELEVLRGVAEGLDAVMVNPALVFGHARPGENTREIAEKIKAEKLPGIPRGGTAVVDARDVATGLRLAMLNGRTGERYFLGAENLSWASIITTLAGAIGVAPPARRVNPSLAMAIAVASEAVALVTRSHPLVSRETVRIANRTYRYSNRKATRELGWNHRSFAETAAYVAGSLT